jgi:hypothetical protein
VHGMLAPSISPILSLPHSTPGCSVHAHLLPNAQTPSIASLHAPEWFLALKEDGHGKFCGFVEANQRELTIVCDSKVRVTSWRKKTCTRRSSLYSILLHSHFQAPRLPLLSKSQLLTPHIPLSSAHWRLNLPPFLLPPPLLLISSHTFRHPHTCTNGSWRTPREHLLL